MHGAAQSPLVSQQWFSSRTRLAIIGSPPAEFPKLQERLQHAGYHDLVFVSEHADALAALSEFPPDAVLLDARAAQDQLGELVPVLRSHQAPETFLPVVVVTPELTPALKELVLEQAVDDLFSYPPTDEDLRKRLANLLRIRRLYQELQARQAHMNAVVEERTLELEGKGFDPEMVARRYEQLADLSARLEVLTEPLRVAAEGLRAFMRMWDFDLGVLYKVEGALLEPVLVVGEVPRAAEKAVKKLEIQQPGSLQRQLLEGAQPILVPDYSRWEGSDPHFRDMELATLVGVPLRMSGELFGVLYIGKFKQVADIGPDTKTVLSAIQLRIERALERIHLLESLRETRQEALRVVGLTLEYRDFETKGHTDRVTRLAEALGQACGLSAEELEQLTWGSYLHDVGKIAIPDQILLKPGRLTASEFEYIKSHTLIGEEMLRNLSFLSDVVLKVVRHHHERWDGTGYPDGLARDEIPYLARLFAISDVYDALTSARPYKEAWSHEEAVAELNRQRGHQFDPDLVDLFMARAGQDIAGLSA